MTQQSPPAGIPLPPGLEPLPDRGPDVVGTKPRMLWVVLVWISAAAMTLLAVLFGAFLFGPRSQPGLVFAFVVFLVIAVAIVGLALTMTRPILTIDGEALRTHAVFGKGSILLRTITDLKLGPLGRSMVVTAEGGITTGSKLSKKKWITIANIHTYRVAPGQLRDYVAARAQAARR